MLSTIPNQTTNPPAPLNIFERAAARLNRPQAAAHAARRDARLNGAQAVQAAPAAEKNSPKPRRENAGTDVGAEEFLEKFHAMTGPGKTAFYRANKNALKAAAALVEIRESARKNLAAAAEKQTAITGEADLLEKFQAMTGPEKTAFYRANKSALKAAAALVGIAEAAQSNQAVVAAAEAHAARNFAGMQNEPLPKLSGKTLLDRFRSLTGTAKTAFFRTHLGDLKLASIEEG
jgi:hypothetical protein